MSRRCLSFAFALGASLAGAFVLAASPAHAQVSPPAADLCAPNRPDPARAVHLALADPKLIIAVAEATGPRDLQNGTPVRILKLVKGTFPAQTAIADRQPPVTCVSDGVWDVRRPVFGVFLIDGDQIFTLAAWPFADGRAQVGGQSLTIDELLALGRAYVEPTPTPLPPGVPPPPTLVPPDTGATSSLPPTGQPPSGGFGIAVWLAAAAIAALAGVGLVFAARRR